MGHINNYKNFVSLNEAKQLDRTVGFMDGDVVIATQDINAEDINFKRTAKSWWGKNVASMKNQYKQKGNYFKEGDVLYIYVNRENVYVGGKDRERNNALSTFTMNPTLKDMDFRKELIQIAIDEHKAKVIKYDELDEKTREEFETNIKYSKVSDAIRNGNCKMRVPDLHIYLTVLNMIETGISFRKPNGRLKIDVITEDNKKDTYYINRDEFKKADFRVDGEDPIDGDPFKGYTTSYDGSYQKGKVDGNYYQH
ncbi:MAG: hypothetical protein SLAVMIC_00021 [uncultured marine phage]|uniref:Uncharacterized protein n=1 Tax=uncultured marine phage TaxID=707152 RepID=A0A8D9CDD8_9VIRU|nr:MAG: hypothetical protein SLAVMIC_00021 [uncultured marine phage]